MGEINGLEKENKYRAWIVRMAFRCEYMLDEKGNNPLTLKEWGYIRSGKFWRFYSMILTTINKKYRTNMLSLLTSMMTNEQKATYNELERQN